MNKDNIVTESVDRAGEIKGPGIIHRELHLLFLHPKSPESTSDRRNYRIDYDKRAWIV